MVALTGLTFHDLRGVRYQQGVDTVKLMEPLTVYNEEVTGPEHALLIANRACRAALGNRGVAHLAISKDVQLMKLSADKRSLRNPGARSSSSWSPPLSAPPPDQLKAAAELAAWCPRDGLTHIKMPATLAQENYFVYEYIEFGVLSGMAPPIAQHLRLIAVRP